MEPDGGDGSVRIAGLIVPAAEAEQAESLASGTLRRGFDGDAGRLRRFAAVLGEPLPEGTLLALRGSAVAGRSSQTGAPFDALGPGTSDLDLVVLGDAVLDLFAPDAQRGRGATPPPAARARPDPRTPCR